jgi:CHASE2 domain-containing sensor protein
LAEPVTHDPQPWDPGLQHERTGLAWQRTLLSGLTCALLVGRMLAVVWLPGAVATAILALAGTAALGMLALRRFRRNGVALVSGERLADGRAPALVTGLVVATAAAAATFALLG